MNTDKLIKYFADRPIIESEAVATLGGDINSVRVQISRWVSSGVLIPVRRGFYVLSPIYRKNEPNLLFIANTILWPSYVSLQYALSYYGMIPEKVVAITSVTTKRPQQVSTQIGRFEFRHVSPRLLFGYETIEPNGPVPVQIASPEKAILDLIYLTTGSATEIVASSRFQNLEILDSDKLIAYGTKFGGPKMEQAVHVLTELKGDVRS